MWRLAFTEKVYGEMMEHLLSTAPLENGCFLLSDFYRVKGARAMLVTGMVRQGGEIWNAAGEYVLEPRPSFVNGCITEARRRNLGLVFVHTHPMERAVPEFSETDRRANAALFPAISSILPGRPHASLVAGRNRVNGMVFSGGWEPIGRVQVVGSTLREQVLAEGGGGPAGARDAEFDRQIRAFGPSSQERIRRLRVGVVGAGGVGSAVATQLAKVGVGSLVLVDKDSIDPSNVPRLYGASMDDTKRPKPEVLGSHIVRLTGCAVKAVCADVSSEDAQRELVGCDVIFACTDNLKSRDKLNNISIRYYKPLIDVGCYIRSDPHGGVTHYVANSQAVAPGLPCLWCSGTLDGNSLLAESLPEGERRKLEERGYYDGVEVQPSTIALTTLAASLGMNKFFEVMGFFGGGRESRTRIDVKNKVMKSNTAAVLAGCTCQKDRGRPHLPNDPA